MYTLSDYGWMLADRARQQGFLGALERVVTHDSVVLDLGSGPGLLGLHALSRGARKVYAVDTNPLVKLLHRLAPNEIASGRLVVFHGDSREANFTELADVVVADIRGPTSLVNGTLAIVSDALARLATPGAKVLPCRDRIHLAPVMQQQKVAEIRSYWLESPVAWDLSPLYRLEMGQMRRSRGNESLLLAKTQAWGSIEWRHCPSLNQAAVLKFPLTHAGRLDGFLQWFDLDFDDGFTLSNSPDFEDRVYGRMCFMLSEPIEVVAGDQVEVSLKVIPRSDREHWVWSGEVFSARTQSITRFSENSLKNGRLLANLPGSQQ